MQEHPSFPAKPKDEHYSGPALSRETFQKMLWTENGRLRVKTIMAAVAAGFVTFYAFNWKDVNEKVLALKEKVERLLGKPADLGWGSGYHSEENILNGQVNLTVGPVPGGNTESSYTASPQTIEKLDALGEMLDVYPVDFNPDGSPKIWHIPMSPEELEKLMQEFEGAVDYFNELEAHEPTSTD